MTESAQPPQKETTQPSFSHDEAFFKEIEKRAYKGARRALFHAMLVSTATFIVLWMILAFVFARYVLPQLQQIINVQMQQVVPIPSGEFNQEELLQQFQKFQ